MAEKTSAVTSERFATGLTYQEFLEQAKVNKDRFQHFYDSLHLTPEETEFFRKAAKDPRGPAKVLVLGEDWCPDVYRGMPVAARIAEAAGLEMRVFPRDKNLDIMNEFLNQGKYLSIPVAVFYTRDHRYIGHWIERSAFANKDRAEIEAQVKAEVPDGDEQKVRALTREKTEPRYPLWQRESVREMQELIGRQLGQK